MNNKIKITPRASRLAQTHNINVAAIDVKGTGFQGGITEKDLLAWIDAGGMTGLESPSAMKHVASESGVRATPLARKMAEARGVPISEVQGSGSFGKVMKSDVLGQGKAKAKRDENIIGVTSDGKRIAKIAPYSGTRKVIGDRLSQSMFTAPHVFLTQKVDLSEVLSLRTLVNSKQDKKTSVTDYVARAVVMTLQMYPEMNASLQDAGIEEYASVNLGIAVAAPSGLIVPVIKEAQDLSVVGISKVAGEMFDKARDGKLRLEDYTGGTFTISNLGMFGIEEFTAIINPPEVGILAVSAMKDDAVVVEDKAGTKRIEIRPMMNITLSVDHRVIDGLLGAQVVTEIKRLLENPIELMISDWE